MAITSPLQAVCLFFAYAFLGWCVEVAFHAVTTGKVINRGFLNGPVCPIYGFGMLGILALLAPVENNLPLLFLGGICITTAIELVGGWALYRLFHTRWWDYSDLPFNLGGYICAQFSLYWGIGTLVMIRMVHPTVSFLVELIPAGLKVILVLAAGIAFAADIALSASIAVGLDKHLQELDELRDNFRKGSDLLSEKIANRTLADMTKLDESRLQAKLAQAESRDALAALQEEYANRRAELQARRREVLDRIRGNAWYGEQRLLAAFPGARYSRGGEETPLAQLREELFRARLDLKVAYATIDEMQDEMTRLAMELQDTRKELAQYKNR